MEPNDQLNLLRLIKDCKRLFSDETSEDKWEKFANDLIANIPIEFLNSFDLKKLQSFAINLTSIDMLDEEKHETML